LLQRVTGVIHEEQIMSKLLQLHPGYVPSIKKMPPITGSTADPFVRDEIMGHLRRGLAATGLSEDDESSFSNSFKKSSSSLSRSFTRVRSFTRKRGEADSKAGEQRQLEQREKAQDRLRSSLSMVAASNAFQRTIVDKINREEQPQRRASIVGATGMGLAASLLGGKPQSFQKKESKSPSNSQTPKQDEDDPLAC